MSKEFSLLQMVKNMLSVMWVTPQTVVHAQSSSAAVQNLAGAGIATLAKQSLSGALTANTLKTVLSITDRPGRLDVVGVTSTDGTTRSHRIKITLDGAVFYDATSGAATGAGYGTLAVGGLTGSGTAIMVIPFPVTWRKSCVIEISSSVTETDKTNVYLRYQA